MSEVERHIGKLKKVDLNGKSIDEWYKSKCKELGILTIPFYETYKSTYCDKVYPLCPVEVDGKLFEIMEDQEVENYVDISILDENPDGTFRYVMQFYNGGTCLTERLEDALKDKNELL